ncbi:MAG: hypothetical protein AB7T10_00205 [bacterium]
MIKCIIPARKNSRRIIGKNLLKLNGDTLIDIAVESALQSSVCDEIIVSTDISDGFRRMGVTVDRRPAATAKSRSSSGSLIEHLIKKHRFNDDDTVILLQPTSPNRRGIDIKRALEIFKTNNVPVVSVFEYNKLSDNLFKPEKEGFIRKISFKERMIYRMNGAIFIFSVTHFKKCGGVPQERVMPYIMDEKDSTDIDEYLDYIKAVVLK